MQEFFILQENTGVERLRGGLARSGFFWFSFAWGVEHGFIFCEVVTIS